MIPSAGPAGRSDDDELIFETAIDNLPDKEAHHTVGKAMEGGKLSEGAEASMLGKLAKMVVDGMH